MDTYDSNEAMLASLKAGGMGTYDVAVPATTWFNHDGEGLLDTIADGELANKGNIAPSGPTRRLTPAACIRFPTSGAPHPSP